jgi:transposase
LERIPRQFYTDEFRHEAVSLVVDGGLTVAEVSRRLSGSQQTVRNWIKKFRCDGLVASGGRSVSDLEAEVSNLRKELAEARLVKEILKKAWRTLQGSRGEVCDD